MALHKTQKKILELSKTLNLADMSLRQIGRMVSEDHPEKIKYHINKLEKKGLIIRDENTVKPLKKGPIKNSGLVAVPVVGLADCGTPGVYADQVFEGLIQVSSKLLRKEQGVFAIKAQGDSMNNANINGECIEDGDYVLVDGNNHNIKNGDYVVVAVDEVAGIKRLFKEENKRVVLVSESTHDYPPIYLHPDDKFIINGKVIQVIKKPKVDWYFSEQY